MSKAYEAGRAVGALPWWARLLLFICWLYALVKLPVLTIIGTIVCIVAMGGSKKRDTSEANLNRLRKEVNTALATNFNIPTEWVAIDFETSGLSAADDRIIEIGAIQGSRDDLALSASTFKTFSTLVNPGLELSDKITDITGISTQMLRTEGEVPSVAIKDLIAFIGDRPCIAFNAKFDRAFLEAECKRYGHTPPERWICALELARQAWPNRPSYKLSDLTASLGNQSHRALDDAQRALTVYTAAMLRL